MKGTVAAVSVKELMVLPSQFSAGVVVVVDAISVVPMQMSSGIGGLSKDTLLPLVLLGG